MKFFLPLIFILTQYSSAQFYSDDPEYYYRLTYIKDPVYDKFTYINEHVRPPLLAPPKFTHYIAKIEDYTLVAPFSYREQKENITMIPFKYEDNMKKILDNNLNFQLRNSLNKVILNRIANNSILREDIKAITSQINIHSCTMLTLSYLLGHDDDFDLEILALHVL